MGSHEEGEVLLQGLLRLQKNPAFDLWPHLGGYALSSRFRDRKGRLLRVLSNAA